MEPQKKSHGALIGSIIIIVILAIGGVYVWQTKLKSVLNQEVKEEQTENMEIQGEEITQEEYDSLNLLEEESNTMDSAIDIDPTKVE